MNHRVIVVCGSESDLPCMEGAIKALEEFEIPFELRVVSAHRAPDFLREALAEWTEHGAKVIIAGAGSAAHLAGTLAAQILAVSDPALRKRLLAYKEGLELKVRASDARNRRGTHAPQAVAKE